MSTLLYCDRCHSDLRGCHIMSWFTEEIICLSCSEEEDKIKAHLRAKGSPDMEGCGFVPKRTE